jgi:hypothetical protein
MPKIKEVILIQSRRYPVAINEAASNGGFAARVLTAYQALIFLAERGFASEVRVTCRSILEAKFKLGFLADDPAAPNLILASMRKSGKSVFEK